MVREALALRLHGHLDRSSSLSLIASASLHPDKTVYPVELVEQSSTLRSRTKTWHVLYLQSVLLISLFLSIVRERCCLAR